MVCYSTRNISYINIGIQCGNCTNENNRFSKNEQKIWPTVGKSPPLTSFSKYGTLMVHWGSIRALCKTGIVSGFICFLRRKAIGRSKLGRNGTRQGTSAPLALPDPDSPIKLTVFWHEIDSVLHLPKSGRCDKKEVDWFLCVLCWNAGGGPGSRSVRGWRIAHVVRFVRFCL